MTFEDAFRLIVDVEKGYVNDPNDPGGETKYGVSKRSYPDIDIKTLTISDAMAIFRRDYWDLCHCDSLPKGVDLMVFNSAVNQGAPTAIRILQRIVGVKDDGVMGPETIRAASRPDILEEFATQQEMHYTANPLFLRDGLGWTRRTMKMLAVAALDRGR